MTLTEAILHAEEVAKEKEEEAQDLEYSKLDWKDESNQCKKCAEEHRQLAEWLKDYKRLLEQEPRKDEVVLTKEEYKELVSSEFDNGYAKGYRETLEQASTLDKVIAEIEEIETYDGIYVDKAYVLQIIDKYRESED